MQNAATDISSTNEHSESQDIIAEIKAAADAHQETVVAVPSQLEIPLPE